MKHVLSVRHFFLTLCLLLGVAGLQSQAYAEDTPVAQVVNINTASAEEIANTLTGVGETKAKAIVSYREQNGKFKSADDLMMVKGVGPATIEKNKGKITY